MRGIRNLIGKVLTCPMFIMFAVFPHLGIGHVIYYPFVSHPNFWFVLSISEGKLLLGEQLHLEKLKLGIDPSFGDFSGLRHLIIFVTAWNDADPFKFTLRGLWDFHPPFFTEFAFEKDDG